MSLRLDDQLCFPLYAAARAVQQRYRPLLAELAYTIDAQAMLARNHAVEVHGRGLAAVEARTTALDATSQERVQTALGEITELGGLVKQLAVSIAAHDDILSARQAPMAAANDRPAPRKEAAVSTS